MIKFIEYLNMPEKIALVLIGIFLFLQAIGEILEFTGKAVPEFLKIRKYFRRKKQENKERLQTLKEVKQLLNDVNNHYSVDNITKRDGWIQWVNDRAVVYDDSIETISKDLKDVVQALKDNTKMTEEIFVQSSRDRIIDFATKVADKNAIVSREEFNRIFKVYDKYEKFLEDRGLTNGEIDIAYQIINEAYKERMMKHSFLEDVRGYNV